MSFSFKDIWFNNPQWWFSQDYDKEITDKYEYLLNQPDPIDPINTILIYDQLPRHIYRNGPNDHIISYFLQKALSIKIDYDRLDDNEYCFAMLPLRHTKDFKFIVSCVLPQTWERIYKSKSPILGRFLKATYERCPLVGAKLDTRFLLSYSSTILAHNPIINFKPFLGVKNMTDKIVISLSGGVDSMVCSMMLIQMYENISAVHINYGNRPTNNEEENFVVDWCNSILHIPCYVRHISEINRKQCMEYGFRELYETYTRDVRYFAYKEFGKEFGKDVKIVLGHNKDDIMENIFTNIANKNKYENLDGMTEYSTQDGICFWRPLLYLSKEEIITYAHEHNIPYLPNSTPTWSQRGFNC